MTKRTGNSSRNEEIDAWVLEVAPRAVAYAISLVRDVTTAEDVVQDCFFRLLQKGAHYDLARDGTKLLYKAITNACINVLTRRRPVISLNLVGRDEKANWELEDRNMMEPKQELLCRELEDAIGEGLHLLPVQQRAALELKSMGHTQKEIADMLETTVSNAGVLIHRARQAMAEFLSPFLGKDVDEESA